MKIFAVLIATLAFATLLNADTDPNTKNEWGRTHLHWAAEKGYTETVAELLAAGADPNAKDFWGVPLCYGPPIGRVSAPRAS